MALTGPSLEEVLKKTAARVARPAPSFKGGKDEYSPVLKMTLANNIMKGVDNTTTEIPVFAKKGCLAVPQIDGLAQITEARIVTVDKLEKAMLYVLLRTIYKGSFKVAFGRYTFDFGVCPAWFLRRILLYILNCNLKRINLSWVPPIQTLILEKELSVLPKKNKKKCVEEVTFGIAPPDERYPDQLIGRVNERQNNSLGPAHESIERFLDENEPNEIKRKTGGIDVGVYLNLLGGESLEGVTHAFELTGPQIESLKNLTQILAIERTRPIKADFAAEKVRLTPKIPKAPSGIKFRISTSTATGLYQAAVNYNPNKTDTPFQWMDFGSAELGTVIVTPPEEKEVKPQDNEWKSEREMEEKKESISTRSQTESENLKQSAGPQF